MAKETKEAINVLALRTTIIAIAFSFLLYSISLSRELLPASFKLPLTWILIFVFIGLGVYFLKIAVSIKVKK